MFASESILSKDYYNNLVAEQLKDDSKIWKSTFLEEKKLGKEVLGRSLQFSSLPISTVLRRGPEGLNPPCLCPDHNSHISFFEAMTMDLSSYELNDFCHDRNTFLVHRLPCWLTGLKNKTEFLELPTVYHLFNVFSRGTFWWKGLKGRNNNEQFRLSKEARLILFSSTGLPLYKLIYMSTKQLLTLSCTRPGLSRLKNWFITLDGLLISILLASKGHPEICNWEFFDRVMQTYLKNAIGDLFRMDNGPTYYSNLKECRKKMKEVILKERTTLKKDVNGDYFNGNYWYFNKLIDVLKLNVSILNPAQLKSLSYITQTRACGLPPHPVELRALEKFEKMTGIEPEPLKPLYVYDLSRAIDSMCLEMKARGNFEALLNTACSQSKISLSNSSCFSCTREDGGKVEMARILLNELPKNCPFFDLGTGKVLYEFDKDYKGLTPGEKLFHYSIFKALSDFTSVEDGSYHIGDVRVSTVLEPGKARVITVSTLEHSVVLHPMAHFLSVLIATFESSRTGLVASNHMWDTFKRIGRENMPMDGIYSTETPTSTHMGSEDWESATDALNPYPVKIIFDGLWRNLGIPRFYAMLCSTLLTMPRRVFHKDVIVSKDYDNPLFVKKNGIFQGDPCCKQTLHMVHILSRIIARNRLKSIGLKVQLPPYITDKNGNKFGSIPNTLITMERLPREEYLETLKEILGQSKKQEELTPMEMHKLMMRRIQMLKKPPG